MTINTIGTAFGGEGHGRVAAGGSKKLFAPLALLSPARPDRSVTLMTPVNVFVPLRITVPLPPVVRPFVPAITELIVTKSKPAVIEGEAPIMVMVPPFRVQLRWRNRGCAPRRRRPRSPCPKALRI